MFHHNLLVLLLHLYILAHHRLRTQPQRQANDETDTHLSYDLILTFQSLLVTTENLDIVVEESQET